VRRGCVFSVDRVGLGFWVWSFSAARRVPAFRQTSSVPQKIVVLVVSMGSRDCAIKARSTYSTLSVNRVSSNKQSLDMTCHTLLVPTSLRKSKHDFRGGNFLWSVRVSNTTR